MAARKRVLTFRQVESWRMGIKIGRLRTELHRVVFGEREMSYVQLGAAKLLLDKAIPDLRTVEHLGHVAHHHDYRQYSDDELYAIIEGRAGGSARIDAAPQGALVAPGVCGMDDSTLEGGEDPPDDQ